MSARSAWTSLADAPPLPPGLGLRDDDDEKMLSMLPIVELRASAVSRRGCEDEGASTWRCPGADLDFEKEKEPLSFARGSTRAAASPACSIVRVDALHY